MDIQSHLDAAEQFLTGLETGGVPVSDCYQFAEQIDALLLHYSLRYLREKYPGSHPESQGIAARILEFSTNYPDMVAKIKEAEEDPIREWFEDTYTLRDFFGDPEKMLSLILDKIES